MSHVLSPPARAGLRRTAFRIGRSMLVRRVHLLLALAFWGTLLNADGVTFGGIVETVLLAGGWWLALEATALHEQNQLRSGAWTAIQLAGAAAFYVVGVLALLDRRRPARLERPPGRGRGRADGDRLRLAGHGRRRARARPPAALPGHRLAVVGPPAAARAARAGRPGLRDRRPDRRQPARRRPAVPGRRAPGAGDAARARARPRGGRLRPRGDRRPHRPARRSSSASWPSPT